MPSNPGPGPGSMPIATRPANDRSAPSKSPSTSRANPRQRCRASSFHTWIPICRFASGGRDCSTARRTPGCGRGWIVLSTTVASGKNRPGNSKLYGNSRLQATGWHFVTSTGRVFWLPASPSLRSLIIPPRWVLFAGLIAWRLHMPPAAGLRLFCFWDGLLRVLDGKCNP